MNSDLKMYSFYWGVDGFMLVFAETPEDAIAAANKKMGYENYTINIGVHEIVKDLAIVMSH